MRMPTLRPFGEGCARGEAIDARTHAIRRGSGLLQDAQDPETYPLFALMPPGHHQAPKVRAFIDFLIERLGSAPWRTGIVRGA